MRTGPLLLCNGCPCAGAHGTPRDDAKLAIVRWWGAFLTSKQPGGPHAVYVQSAKSTPSDSLLGTVYEGAWIHCTLAIRAGDGDATTIRMTGIDVAPTIAIPRVEHPPEIELGVDKGGLPEGGVTARFDDVRLRALP